MKKIIIILFLLVSIFKNDVKGQATPPVTDTLAYLKNIVNNKAQYIGQPFSALMNTLQIQIKFFSPLASTPYDKTKETSTSFSFYFPQTAEEIYLTYPILEVYWQPHLNANQSRVYYNNYNGGGWNATVNSFYSSGIIADIKVIE